jgi:AraC family transcriptional regulator
VSELASEALILQILATCSRSAEVDRELSSGKWVTEVRDLLHSRFADVLTLDEIALGIGKHPLSLARAFRDRFGCTVGEYVRRLRMEDAARRIASSPTPVKEIALAVGYSDTSQFIQVFREHTGLTPAQFRRSLI